jgi:hypothetical protein
VTDKTIEHLKGSNCDLGRRPSTIDCGYAAPRQKPSPKMSANPPANPSPRLLKATPSSAFGLIADAISAIWSKRRRSASMSRTRWPFIATSKAPIAQYANCSIRQLLNKRLEQPISSWRVAVTILV